MATKELQTRIALKYDSYSAWTTAPGKDLVLLAGELGICNISDANQNSNVVPTVLFKVGDGTKTFEQLPWASAKAADVYSWAKASEVKRDGKKLVFVGGAAGGGNLEVAFDYVTLAEVQEITNGLASRITTLEDKFKGENDVQGQLDALDGRLDVLEGADTVEGSVAKALKDAKDYTDTREAAIKTAYEAYADQAEADTKSYVDDEVSTLEAKDTELAGQISSEVTARENADKAINDKIGGSFTSTNTVAKAISDAQATAEANAATTAQNKVDALANGQVNTNTEAIATNASEIARVEGLVTAEAKARDDADKALDERLDKVEAFFEGAAEDSEGLNDALDKLVDIQNYLSGEGSATNGLLGQVATNTEAIESLSGRMDTAEDDIDALEAKDTEIAGNVTTLQNIVDGYSTKGAIKTAIDAAATKGQTGIDNAATAQNAADKAQGDVNTLAGVVNNETTGLAATKNIADKAASDIAALTTRVTTAEGDIDDLEAIVTDAEKGNEKLRTDVNALQTLTGDSAKGNTALYNEITRVAGLVDNSTTGLAATKSIADAAKKAAEDNAADITTIKTDYLKAADVYIFNCGSSTTVTHEQPQA